MVEQLLPQISLYFHIPFCTRKCPYCHFYVELDKKRDYLAFTQALLFHWEQLAPTIASYEVVSIYFGGGTPTLLGSAPIEALLSAVAKRSKVSKTCEITLEANPENLTQEKMVEYQLAGINRVSIGVQSLDDESLKRLRRTHNAQKAKEAILSTYSAGISNISIDLMYELPDQTVASFEKTLAQVDQLPIHHLSLYNLTIEPNTPFARQKLTLPTQEEGLEMLQIAVHRLEEIGLSRYEISAFCQKGYPSLHNMGYWTARPFLGIGPSAFTYFGGVRSRNVANLSRYIEQVHLKQSPIDFSESLPYPRNVLELLAVELRLIEGVDLHSFPIPDKTLATLKKLIESGYLTFEKERLKLSDRGLLFYDTVAAELIEEEENNQLISLRKR